MFNPEKLLSGMIGGGMRNIGGNIGALGNLARLGNTANMSNLSGMGTKAGIGLGLLGVALGAVEHYMKKEGTSHPDALPPSGASPASPPPPPPRGVSAAPPPPPPAGAAAPSAATTPPQSDAVLLIRAMIASANADGLIDADERRRIVERLEAVGLSEEERDFITAELANPADASAIADQVRTPEMADQVYAASLLAIEVDTEAERDYLRQLATRLGLAPSRVEEIHARLGVEPL